MGLQFLFLQGNHCFPCPHFILSLGGSSRSSNGKETIIGAHSAMEVLNEVITALDANRITVQLGEENSPDNADSS
jgi:hypothetical protein